MSEVKTHLIKVTVTDSFSPTHYSFQVTVTNQPPRRVNSTIQPPVRLQFGQSLIHNLPYSIDPEGLNFTTSLINPPSFVSLISNTSMRINPVNCRTDFGNKTVLIKLEDE
jgi:hypothetical protein